MTDPLPPEVALAIDTEARLVVPEQYLMLVSGGLAHPARGGARFT